ncbi:leucine-rich repeat domain-containing protein [Flavobacterium sp. N3904]|uniref:DUF7619 domain-containing protein n=1 Tax=Flavobacterium sp. N3904 TaxID=2986835 RepID=UPI00222571A5|nr:leucine-rich repeat domain-containing protein [Flavobacterium sp. N3904]
MKKIYFLFLAFCFFNCLCAQVINFPDANFKNALIASNETNILRAQDEFKNYIKIDSNNDGEIDVDEASIVVYLYLGLSSISSLEGISNFPNLIYLQCSNNSISSLEVNSLTKLEELYCNDNLLTSLDVSALKNIKTLYVSNNKIETLNFDGLMNLEFLMFDGNKIKSLDISSFPNLIGLACGRNELTSIKVGSLKEMLFLYCSDNQLTTLDLTGLPKLNSFECDNNQLLTSLFLKNGINEPYMTFRSTPNLEYICIDDSQFTEVQKLVSQYNYTNCQINSYCSFNPGGIYYTVDGNSRFDSNSNGCDASDFNYSNLNFNITDGTHSGNFISDTSGNYSMSVQEGTHTITPILENPSYYSVSPTSITVNFPTQSSPFTQYFCITPNGIHNDLEITILPIAPARPGFDVTYKIIYKNEGTSVQSGSVSLSFNDAVLDFITAVPIVNSQVTDKLTWDYTNLRPLESRVITVTLNVNSPMGTPAVNIGDRLSFNAIVTPVMGDEKPVDNVAALRQIVVGSLDPNDKTCLEGDVITPSLIGEYVNYLIRFENTGTYPAQNIVVKDMIDLSKFDISTLVPTSSSHSYTTKISDGNKVEFIFENVNLPFDDANNDGFIAFKIKTKPTLAVGDSFENEANIYFDYNFPVLTNRATSTFKTLGTQDFEFSNYFSVYPSPTNDILNIGMKNSIEIESIAVYDILGQLVLAIPDAQKVSTIDVSKLNIGNYFLRMKTNKGISSMKFIKQ